MLEASSVVAMLSGTLGLPLAGSRPATNSVQVQLDDGQDAARTFAFLATLTGRQLRVQFRPGRWAGELVHAMGRADDEARRMWLDLVSRCVGEGAGRVTMSINGTPADPLAPADWPSDWQLLDVAFERGPVALDAYDRDAMGLLSPEQWIARFASAVASLLPLEEAEASQFDPEVEGDPTMVTHLRYERSRRNRAAAIAIHGYDCRACGLNMQDIYGELGAGFVHVHHETSLAEQGGAQAVDPYTGLVPLCPSCHGIVHRRRPPRSIAEVRAAVLEQRAKAASRSDAGRRQGSSRPT